MKLSLSRPRGDSVLATVAMIMMMSARPVAADFGDYVDLSFNCPAFITCKAVCVANATDCPPEMRCEGLTEQLCLDGTCAESCEGIEEGPCAFDCAPVACAKVVNDFYDSCFERFGAFYDNETACGEAEVDDSKLLTYTEHAFIFYYVWYSVCPLVLFIWCAYNQRISPVSGSCQKLDLEVDGSSERKKDNARIAWQTGYKTHPIGFFVSILTYLTIFAVYSMLCWLIIQYYIQQEAITWSFVSGKFESEYQVLLCFITLWFVGFFWMFSLKFPHSIFSLHLRRCVLSEAQYVAVAVKRLEVGTTEVVSNHDHLKAVKMFFASFGDVVYTVMTFVFSDANTFGCERKGDASFCFRPVETDPDDGTRYFTFEFRRYSLNDATATDEEYKFVPGSCDVGQTIGDILKLDNGKGMSPAQIQIRTRILGRNKIEMIEPKFRHAVAIETSTPFFTYQMFMVLSWFPLW
jgi:hypothetical protein